MKYIIYNNKLKYYLIQLEDTNSISISNKENPFLIMSNLKDCNELHLLAHGSPGHLDLGTGINIEALYENAEYLSTLNIEKIILWGCNVGKNIDFIKLFSHLTNSTVYSSVDYLGKNKGMLENDFDAMNDFVKNLPFYLSWSPLYKSSVRWSQLGNDIDGDFAEDNSGYSVAISSDGNTIAIGAINNDGNGDNSGQVRIYNYNDFSWNQIGNDIYGEFEQDNSGFSVSLSSNGHIVAIGAIYNSDSASASGHVRIYNYNGSSWNQIGSDIDGEVAFDLSGHSVSLSSDGYTVAIGATFNSDITVFSGHVRIWEYVTIANEWFLKGDDIDGETIFDYSGFSVSLSSDGNIVAIGEMGYPAFDGTGRVRIYNWNSGFWNLIGDIDGNAIGDNSGNSVSLSSDGYTVAIGATGNDSNGNDSGHVRIYNYQGTEWNQIGGTIEGEAVEDFSGKSVSLSSDGNTVAIGATANDGNGDNSGQVRIYNYQGTEWNLIGNIYGEAAGDFSGYSVSLSSDGNIVIIGAIYNSDSGINSGHVRIYRKKILSLSSLQRQIAAYVIPVKKSIDRKSSKTKSRIIAGYIIPSKL